MRLVIYFICAISFYSGASSASECPRDNFEWRTRLQTFAENLIPDLGNNNLYKRGPKLLPPEKYMEVIQFWNQCEKKSNKEVRSLYENILKHSHFMAKAMADGHAGFKISDKDYLFRSAGENLRYAELPNIFFEENYLPVDWEEKIQSCESNNNGEICNKIKDWRFLSFHSTLEDGSGHHRRVIVQIPSESYQQYLLFFPDHPEHKKSKLVDIITLKTHDSKSGIKLSRSEIFFFERHAKGFAIDGGRCITCHSNGLREVHPIQGSVLNSSQFEKIKSFNKNIRGFAKVDWRGIYDASALGPPIGQSCTKCHSNEGKRAPLTIFTKPSLIRSKIHELEMPYPGLYTFHHNSLKSMVGLKAKKDKKQIQDIALSVTAKPGKDYRSAEDIRGVRSKLHSELLRNGTINHLEYVLIKATDTMSSLHIDYKLNHLFDEHKEKLKIWLQGDKLE